jgi:coproporphyrinogen III oxidase
MNLQEKQNLTSVWFRDLRDQICAEFEKIEEEYLRSENKPIATEFKDKPKFLRKNWERSDKGKDGGSGEMSVMKGNVFEKVGVNFSKVYGEFNEEFRRQIPGAEKNPQFWASGISLVAHMRSPLVPAVHMNTRFICTDKSWFGGGADLNPMFENVEDTADFHQAFQLVCDRANPDYYAKFKSWCDEYFFIKHRGVSRGVGGIFYDYLGIENPVKTTNSGAASNHVLNQDFDSNFAFTKDVGLAFLKIFPEIVRRNMLKTWTDEQREHQLQKRGFYAEFNLLYDRGTKFGLMTGGNTEAILMSLPPVAKWE